jgi:hypothetical protein
MKNKSIPSLLLGLALFSSQASALSSAGSETKIGKGDTVKLGHGQYVIVNEENLVLVHEAAISRGKKKSLSESLSDALKEKDESECVAPNWAQGYDSSHDAYVYLDRHKFEKCVKRLKNNLKVEKTKFAELKERLKLIGPFYTLDDLKKKEQVVEK